MRGAVEHEVPFVASQYYGQLSLPPGSPALFHYQRLLDRQSHRMKANLPCVDGAGRHPATSLTSVGLGQFRIARRRFFTSRHALCR
jgi:hypothetical protein